MLITNTGTVALTNVYGTDTLAQADCGGFFVASNLAAGATTEYECQTNNAIQTMTNTATATGEPPSGAPVTSSASSLTAVVSGYLRNHTCRRSAERPDRSRHHLEHRHLGRPALDRG